MSHNSTSTCGMSRLAAILAYERVREGVFARDARVRRRALRSALEASMSNHINSGVKGLYDYLRARWGGRR